MEQKMAERKTEDLMVLAAVHCGGSMNPDFVKVLLSLVAMQHCKLGITIIMDEPPHESLNKIVETGIDAKFDYICIMDADTTNIMYDVLDRLLAWEKDIVGAYSFNRGFPYLPNVFKLNNPDEKLWDHTEDHNVPYGYAVGVGQGLQPVDMISTQMLLIKTEVFSKIEWPWFSYRMDCLPDAYFCQKAKDAGYQVWCDTNYVAEHGGMNPLKREYLIRYECLLRKEDPTKYLATSPITQNPLFSQQAHVEQNKFPEITPFKTVEREVPQEVVVNKVIE